jgi:hypothetical protein
MEQPMANPTDTLPHAPSQPPRSARGGPITGHQHRRALLGALAAVPLVGAGAAVAASARPDAELLQAEQDWRAAFRAWSALCRTGAEGVETDPLWHEQRRLVAVVIALPARTPAGIAVKIRMAFFQQNEGMEIEEFLIHDGPRPDDLLDEDERHLMWQAIEALDAMPGGRAVA